MAVDRPSDIGRVNQHAAQGRGIPDGLAFSALNPGLLQPAAGLAQAEAVMADPAEHQPNDFGLVRNHLEACQPSALVLGHITVSHPRRLRSRILARSYSAITPCICSSRSSSAVPLMARFRNTTSVSARRNSSI